MAPLSVWISSDDVKAVVDQGFRVIHAASNYFYLVGHLNVLIGIYPLTPRRIGLRRGRMDWRRSNRVRAFMNTYDFICTP